MLPIRSNHTLLTPETAQLLGESGADLRRIFIQTTIDSGNPLVLPYVFELWRLGLDEELDIVLGIIDIEKVYQLISELTGSSEQFYSLAKECVEQCLATDPVEWATQAVGDLFLIASQKYAFRKGATEDMLRETRLRCQITVNAFKDDFRNMHNIDLLTNTARKSEAA